ncbi:MAG TPA: cation diffusion facilitator family transporter [Cyclobacteriaceae bacterium]|nr:cation diffusion facilitator family transporter [Cyclobacteriaceae bacterium]
MPSIVMAASRFSVYSALTANLLIAATKFVAGNVSNSASMISEGIHSLVDTINQFLLLHGIRRSQKLPDADHPFGYGKELYFWSFIVSILIFGLGGGVSVYQGIVHILRPEPLGDPTINYIVLGISILFEGTSLMVAARDFNRIKGDTGWWQAIVLSKDPSSFLVLFEDLAAVIGLVIVMVCVFLSHLLSMPVLDGVGSLLVGMILILVSSILARESRSLLMGEGIAVETQTKIKALVERSSTIKRVQNIFSSYQSPTEVVIMIVAEFDGTLPMQIINKEIDALRQQIMQQYSRIKFVFIQPATP